MPNIQLSELSPTGSELFHDSENFLHELSAEEVGGIIGGEIPDVSGILTQIISGANGVVSASQASVTGGQNTVSLGATVIAIFN